MKLFPAQTMASIKKIPKRQRAHFREKHSRQFIASLHNSLSLKQDVRQQNHFQPSDQDGRQRWQEPDTDRGYVPSALYTLLLLYGSGPGVTGKVFLSASLPNSSRALAMLGRLTTLRSSLYSNTRSS
jgi:hypothetical protein